MGAHAIRLRAVVAEPTPAAPGRGSVVPNMDQVVATARRHQLEGRPEQAKQLLRRALQAEPNRHDANHLYGMLLMESKQIEQAEYYVRRAIASRPDDAELHNTLAMILASGGKPGQAAEVLERTVGLHGTYLPALMNLAHMRLLAGEAGRAEECYRRAAAIAPDDPGPACGLADVLVRAGRGAEAAELMRTVLGRDPRHKPAMVRLVHALYFVGDADAREMEEWCRRAMAADPADPEPPIDLAMLLLKTGRANEAADVLRAVARRVPGHIRALDWLAHVLNYAEDAGEREVLEAHAAYGRALSATVRPLAPPPNPRDPARRLRVGYLSSDLRGHSVAAFLEPLLEQHDRGAFEVYCYSGTVAPDETTRRLAGYPLAWRETAGLDDRRLAERVREDGIDILVELNGHTAGERLAVMAMRPAPVQATFIGYPNTTGVAGVGYRLVDAITDPPELGADARCVERLARIPGCFLCYRPPPREDDPGVGPPPARAGAPVTFGSFNIVSKIGPGTGALWAEVLRRAPGSRLVLKSINLGPESVRRLTLDRLAACGIDPARVELRGGDLRRRDHLAAYGGIDIALDTFPYHGTTTTCEALWMGVPVVTLAGRVHASRVGVSLLTAVGVPELIAADRDGYVRLAVELAGDPARLARLRAELRERVRSSILCDSPGYARRVEGVLRDTWRAWCGGAK